MNISFLIKRIFDLSKLILVKIIFSYNKIKLSILDEVQFLKFSKYIKGVYPLQGNCERKKTIIIDGNDHEIIWSIRWSVLMLPLLRNGYESVVLTRRSSNFQNKYYKLFGCRRLLFIDDFFADRQLPETLMAEVDLLLKHHDIKESLLDYRYKDIPVGKITLSGYSRYQLRGNIDFNCPNEIEKIKGLFCKNLIYAYFVEEFLGKITPDLYITSEAFHDEHGVFYYYIINKRSDVIKVNLSTMDDCIILQRRNMNNDGMHHNTVTQKTFEKIYSDKKINADSVKAFVEANSNDRYSEKWHLSKRNFRNTSLVDRNFIINEYGLDPSKKIAVIFSHILYDTLYFFEEELYANYTEWLIDTIRIAIENSNMNWLIKLHPSNIWRGEVDGKGEYEEVRIIKRIFNVLPQHVKIVLPDTKINPLSWIKNADFGITVRGTIGMEMPCFGNHVVTAANGRYTNLGFTIDPKTKSEYRNILLNLHNIPSLTCEQVNRALYYYYAIFALKPLRLTMLEPSLRYGFKEVRLFGSLYSFPRYSIYLNADKYEPELESFARWIEDTKCVDFVQNWESYCSE